MPLHEKVDRELLLSTFRQKQIEQLEVDRKTELLNKMLLKHFKIKKVS